MRREAGVVQETTTLPHALRLWIESNRYSSDFIAVPEIDDAQRFIEAIEHVQPPPSFIDRQSGWSLAYVDSRLNRARGIEDPDFRRPGCRNIK